MPSLHIQGILNGHGNPAFFSIPFDLKIVTNNVVASYSSLLVHRVSAIHRR